MRFALVMLVVCCLILCSCGRWNADSHFDQQKLRQDKRLQAASLARTQEAEANVAKARLTVLSRVSQGMSAAELQDVAGYRFDPLANITSGSEIWERRRYLLSHVVAARWGSFSQETNLCDKEAELFTITLVNGVVRVIDTGY